MRENHTIETGLIVPTGGAVGEIGYGPSARFTEIADDAIGAARDLMRVEAEFGFGGEEDVRRAEKAIKSLRSIERAVEGERKALKAPITEEGRKIDEAAREMRAPLIAEQQRIEAALLRHAERCRRRAEIAAALTEPADVAAQKEIAALVVELNELRADIRTRAGHGDPLPDGAYERMREINERVSALEDEQELRLDARRSAVGGATEYEGGARVRTKWDYEVLDIYAFARAYPDLVTITIKRREVLEALDRGEFPKEILVQEDGTQTQTPRPTAPGLRFNEVVDLKVR